MQHVIPSLTDQIVCHPGHWPELALSVASDPTDVCHLSSSDTPSGTHQALCAEWVGQPEKYRSKIL